MPAERPDYAVFLVSSAMSEYNVPEAHSLGFGVFARAFTPHLGRHFNACPGLYRRTDQWLYLGRSQTRSADLRGV